MDNEDNTTTISDTELDARELTDDEPTIERTDWRNRIRNEIKSRARRSTSEKENGISEDNEISEDTVEAPEDDFDGSAKIRIGGQGIKPGLFVPGVRLLSEMLSSLWGSIWRFHDVEIQALATSIAEVVKYIPISVEIKGYKGALVGLLWTCTLIAAPRVKYYIEQSKSDANATTQQNQPNSANSQYNNTGTPTNGVEHATGTISEFVGNST